MVLNTTKALLVNRAGTIFILCSFLILQTLVIQAQIGGRHTYEFLNLPNSARIAGMGGDFLAIDDDDITLSLANPSLISPAMHNNIGLSFVNYFAKINYGYAQYGRNFNKVGSFVGTLQFIHYGDFDWANDAGTILGKFSSSEYALNIGWGRRLTPHFTIGANWKFIYSHFQTQDNTFSYLQNATSFGMAVDVAGSYIHTESMFVASFIARNIGFQMKPYYTGNGEPLPFEMQIGLSKGLKHLPLKFSLLYNHLEKWDLTYEDPANPSEEYDPLTGEVKKKSGIEKFADNFMRHIVIGGELTIAKIVDVRLGYSYGRRQEMKVASKLSTVGISWGVGLRISNFSFSYSRSSYHLAGSPNYFTITTNLSAFASKKK